MIKYHIVCHFLSYNFLLFLTKDTTLEPLFLLLYDSVLQEGCSLLLAALINKTMKAHQMHTCISDTFKYCNDTQPKQTPSKRSVKCINVSNHTAALGGTQTS